MTSIIFKNVAHGVLALYNEGIRSSIFFFLYQNSHSHNLFYFLIIALKQVSPTEYIRIFLNNLKIPDLISQGLINAWNEKSGKISAYLCSKIVTNNKLIDLDWAFGVTAASDDCNHVGKTFLQIKITTIESQGKLNVTFFELSLDQFYQFLASLEKCRSYLDFVNPK